MTKCSKVKPHHHHQLPFPIIIISRFCLVHLLFISFFLFLPYGAKSITSNEQQLTKIGAIIDFNSRIGHEIKIAMELALLNFNNELGNHKISLHFQNHQTNILQTAKSAERLIKETRVKAIIGMERWEEAALVAEIGSQAEIPVLSLSAPAITPPLASSRWPFLVTMASNDSDQMRCIADLNRAYNWRRVVTVHEDYSYGGDYGELTLLSQALQEVGSEIEHRIVLPPFSSLSNPKQAVRDELAKLEQVQSRVFIVLQTSLPLVIHLFTEAKEMGFVGEDTVWLLKDTVTGFLDSFDTSVIYSMEGALGIKSYYSETSTDYRSFYSQFRRNFRSKYPEEDNSEPGFYALRAYDSIATISKAVQRMLSSSSPESLLNHIISSDFSGLSGEIGFKEGKLLNSPELRIVNVVGKKYKEIDFWSPSSGFMNADGPDSIGLRGPVNWPGDLKRVPKGWAMPSDAKPMIIGVPGRTSFEKFVKVVNASEGRYDGFCIQLFYKVLEILDYNLSYKFVPYNGTYNDLVHNMYNKTYDAIVGDITILAERSERMEFTQPYAESGLSMIVPVKSEESAWMFMKPFTWEMWVVTGSILIYTMCIVWFLEHQTNPEFRGPLKNQIGTAVLFTFSSLFFAHREKIYSNLTRFVLVVWLFVVLILNSSYTASLTSMLTIQRLQPNVTDIDWLKRNNLPVGCDGDSFVRNYLENVLGFKPENIRNVISEYDYTGLFQERRIYAAFLELPYQKVFNSHYCKQYIATAATYRFGGLGFVFQKGSPIAADFSKAILELSEDGKLKNLEEKWFHPSSECEENTTGDRTESLRLKSFMGLFLISAATSTICFLIFLIRLFNNFWHHQKEEENTSMWKRTITLAKYFYHGKTSILGRAPDIHEWNTPRSESSCSSMNLEENIPSYSVADIEVVNIPENLSSDDSTGSTLIDIHIPDSGHS
ncbi:glutamate receptor 2.9-like [Euphorbia lathyris]|uniref:glutamate receptor 2.9-like n=1 Tax=Euphorbia lathyris TaxID=212925 RepID=UPI0033134251